MDCRARGTNEFDEKLKCDDAIAKARRDASEAGEGGCLQAAWGVLRTVLRTTGQWRDVFSGPRDRGVM
ncbi:hypothetical protein NUW54_g335 [Trametes sanguinea]|uniref:Uncharacterized protein n=1 Tax=Trametes sanguinea TaxID=158606 RepID=A0ACC1QBY0_9APHY|nr:hypothetical protein NUW54_g335 [Trametes sanguinea]